MIRRLCLFLLMFCLALPAVAAPMHCAPMAAIEMPHAGTDHDATQHGKGDAPNQQAARHDCIGCAAPFAAARFPGRPAPLPVARLNIPDELQIAAAHSGPEIPPPRA